VGGLRLYNGRWAFLEEHLDRLFEAAKAIDLDIGMDRAGVLQALEETRAANGMTDRRPCPADGDARASRRGRSSTPPSRAGPTMVIIMEHSRPSIPRPIRWPPCRICAACR
jgi:branched-chain amino acid aminotransferase